METHLKSAGKWPEGGGGDAIVNNATNSTSFMCVLPLGVPRGTSI